MARAPGPPLELRWAFEAGQLASADELGQEAREARPEVQEIKVRLAGETLADAGRRFRELAAAEWERKRERKVARRKSGN